MNRPEAVRAVRMYLHYDRTWEESDNPEEAENRRYHYQDLVFDLFPSEEEIEAGCNGRAEDINIIGDLLDTLADYARKS